MHQTNSFANRRPSGTLLPFLIIIIAGLTLVFGFQIFQYFQEQNQKLTENKAALTIIKGRAEMKVWGEERWVPAITASILREGDSLRVASDARVSLTLLNGSSLRVDSNTVFQFTNLKTKDGQDEMSILLENGDVWLRKPKSESLKIAFVVETADFTATTYSTIFSVSKREDLRLRVISGAVTVNVKEVRDGKSNIIETIPVAVGQEFVVTPSILQALRERKVAETVFGHSDEFRASEWYSWNMREDASEISNTLTVAEAVKVDEETKTTITQVPKEKPAETIQPQQLLPSPEIIEPDTAHRQTSAPQLIVRGTTSAQTQKIMVKTFVGGKEDAYALQKYTPGSTAWNYIVAESYGNWIPGRNRFSIIAVDAKGNRSEPTELILVYEKEKPVANLSAPKVLTYNGGQSSETAENSVKVEGSIGKGIVKVYVNDFPLTQYIPSSEKWTYYAKPEYGNLNEGVNTYVIYGIDADGKKTPVAKFTITKKLKPTVTPPSFGTDEGSPLE